MGNVPKTVSNSKKEGKSIMGNVHRKFWRNQIGVRASVPFVRQNRTPSQTVTDCEVETM